MPNITVAICTWNRADLLRQTLEHFGKLCVPLGLQWELLIIDNNSTDMTTEVAESFKALLPVRYIFEPQQGQSYARNRAIEEAKSDWLVFTDDDVIVEPSWLSEYILAIGQVSESVGFLGGEIKPWFPVPPDPDLAKAMPMVANGFCGRDLPQKSQITSVTDYLPLGANFAVRKSLISALRFNTKLGASRDKRVLGEEIAFLQDLIRSGVEGKWVPNCDVRHYVDPERLKLRSLRKQLVGMGRQRVRMGDLVPGKFTFMQLPSWVYREFFEHGAGAFLCWILRRRYHFYKHFARFWICWGSIAEALAVRRKCD